MSKQTIFIPAVAQPSISIEEARARIKNLLEIFEFGEADKIARSFSRADNFSSEYEDLRSKSIGKYLSTYFRNAWKFDFDQLSAISSTGKNTIVSARAGSGKTQVIAGKVAFEIASKTVSPDKILALSFNSKAAGEILDRIRSKGRGFWIEGFYSAKTFHSLAYKIVQPKDEILLDIFKYEHPVTGEEIEVDTKKHKRYIQGCLIDVFDKEMENYMHENLPKHLQELRLWWLLDEDNVYLAKRKEATLFAHTGNFVRSKGEKFLLDFLVEYGFSEIRYEYTMEVPDWKNSYLLKKPDVRCSLQGIKVPIYIEHWWVEDDSKWTPEHWEMTKEEYLENRNTKRKYFLEQEKLWKIIFLETSCNDYGPEASKDIFYKNIKKRFELKLDHPLQKIAIKDFMSILRANDRRVPMFVGLVQRYISLAQLQTKSPDDMASIIKDLPIEKTTSFLKMANRVYRRYEEKKKEEDFMDFNDLLKRATFIIDEMKWDIKIKEFRDEKQVSEMNLKDIELLLIDEYQDFSTLFYSIIQTIAKYNKDFRLFVVGDDWQAINQFAGADIQYFLDFRKKFENESVIEKALTMNYRSKKPIVDMGNRLMSERWKLAVSTEENKEWPIPVLTIIDSKASSDFGWFADILTKSLPISDKIHKNRQQLWKNILFEIIKVIANNEKTESWKDSKIMVITRNNETYWLSIDQWKKSLKKFYRLYTIKESGFWNIKKEEKEFDTFLNTQFEMLTAHKSKGKQADVVILLDVSKKNYPGNIEDLRDNADYFSVFDDTPEHQVENARKLFYVAITRTKSHLYIFADQESMSEYVTEIFPDLSVQ